MTGLQRCESQSVVGLLLAGFDAVDLDALNNRAPLLVRRDSKYVLTTPQLCQFLIYAQGFFDVLQIGDLRQFEYRTVYFDSDAFHCYHDHNKGRRKRVKIRYRNYVDHDRHFFEIKLKGRRNVTKKHRVAVAPPDYAASDLPEPLRRFCDETIAGYYGDGWEHGLTRGVSVHYHRMTLVAKGGAERITVDSRLSFSDGEQSVSLRDSKWVVEVKSHSGASDVDRWLFANGSRPVPQCSKYCMAISLLKLPHKNNRFMPILRRHFKYV